MRLLLAALLGLILPLVAIAQPVPLLLSNTTPGSTTFNVPVTVPQAGVPYNVAVVVWPAASLDVEPYPFFISNQPVLGRTFGQLIWLDDTITDVQGTERPVGDILDLVAEGMRFEARKAQLPEAAFNDGLRFKLKEKLRQEAGDAVREAGSAWERTADPATAKAVLVENMPPAPEGQ